jgi:ABC-type lipoprotein release transport system permease subunit
MPAELRPAASLRRRVLPGIIVGRELAKTLRLFVGDEVSVVSPAADLGPTGLIPKKRSFRVAAIFYTGMYEFDTKYAYTLLPVAQAFFNVGPAVTGLEVRADDPAHAPVVADRVRDALADWTPPPAPPFPPAAAPAAGPGSPTPSTAPASAPASAASAPSPAEPEPALGFDPLAYEESRDAAVSAAAATTAASLTANPGSAAPGAPGATLVDTIGSADPSRRIAGDLEILDWQQMNRGLFSALRLEKTAMFVILTFIVLVAAFNIVSTLVMVVLEKGREIAILKSMGTAPRAIVRLFVVQGLVIGVLGTAWGVTIGYAGCEFMNRVGIQLDPDVYYISSLPVRTDPAEFLLVGLAAVAISVLATIYPAWQAARLNPVDGLRYE